MEKKENKSKIEEISVELRPILTGFLNEECYQDSFKDMAQALGYEGEDMTKAKACLFTASPEGQIGFCLAELNDMFFEYQTIENVKNHEPYKTLLETKPEKRGDVAKLAKKMLTGEVDSDDLEKLFNE